MASRAWQSGSQRIRCNSATHALALGVTIADLCDHRKIGSNTASTVSKKSGAIHGPARMLLGLLASLGILVLVKHTDFPAGLPRGQGPSTLEAMHKLGKALATPSASRCRCTVVVTVDEVPASLLPYERVIGRA